MKILSIGNSFSQDATRYLHGLAKSQGERLKVVNLYIGGCSLKMHYYHMLEHDPAYLFEFNGESTRINVSIKQALMSDDWDYITLQQVSHHSNHYETYQPYRNQLAEFVRKYCPHSKIYIHQTWAYEEGTKRLTEELGYGCAADMFRDIEGAYKRAAEAIHADGIIPSGDLMLRLAGSGIGKIHRDGFHASLGTGRYALALLWYGVFTGRDVQEVTFREFDEPVTEEQIAIIKRTVNKLCGK